MVNVEKQRSLGSIAHQAEDVEIELETVRDMLEIMQGMVEDDIVKNSCNNLAAYQAGVKYHGEKILTFVHVLLHMVCDLKKEQREVVSALCNSAFRAHDTPKTDAQEGKTHEHPAL